jgi:hypothetical protein
MSPVRCVSGINPAARALKPGWRGQDKGRAKQASLDLGSGLRRCTKHIHNWLSHNQAGMHYSQHHKHTTNTTLQQTHNNRSLQTAPDADGAACDGLFLLCLPGPRKRWPGGLIEGSTAVTRQRAQRSRAATTTPPVHAQGRRLHAHHPCTCYNPACFVSKNKTAIPEPRQPNLPKQHKPLKAGMY